MRSYGLAAMLVGSLLLAGCDDPPPPRAAHHTPPRIALVMKTRHNAFFTEMERGARRAESEDGVTLIVTAAEKETSFTEQVGLVEDLIRQGVDAIVLAPADSHKLVPAVKKAQDAGIAVVNLDNRLDAAFEARLKLRPVPVITTDNLDGAYRAAQRLTQGLSHPVEAAMIEGIRNAANAQARKIGALKAFNESPEVKVVASEAGDWRGDRAKTATRSIFAAHPNVKILFCANDTMALAAIDALDEANIHDVAVAGFDAVPEARQALAAGRLAVSVDQQAAEQGYLGVRTAEALLKDQPVPPEQIVAPRLVGRAEALQDSATEDRAAAASSKR